MAAATAAFLTVPAASHSHRHHRQPPLTPIRPPSFLKPKRLFNISCKATDVSSSSAESSAAAAESPKDNNENWVPVVPLVALPKGERRVIIQDGQTILLLWYKDEVFAIENRSPAEGAYTEGLLNAKLTQVSSSPLCLFNLFLFLFSEKKSFVR